MEQLSVNQKDYQVIRLLGKGKGGYSYLVTDGDRNYVLKQIHHEPCDYYTFGNKLLSEEEDYKKLVKTGIRIPKMLEIDYEKERILKEYIEGETIYDLVMKEEVSVSYLDQIHEMCDKLYPYQLNIDYFPTNFVVQDDLLWYIDYECNEYSEEWNFVNWGYKYWFKSKEFLDYVKEHS